MSTMQTSTVPAWASLRDELRYQASASGSLYTDPQWIALEEEAHPSDHFYVTASENGALGAFGCAYRFDEDSNPWPAARVDLFLEQNAGPADEQRPAGDWAALLPSYLLGGRRPGHSELSVETDADPATVESLAAALVDRAVDEATRRGAATLAALYCEPFSALSRALAERGAYRFAAPANNVIDLPDGGPEDWLVSLGKKRRSNVMADMRKLNEAAVTYTVSPLDRSDLDDVVRLELTNYTKYGHDYDPREARSLHEAYLHHLGDRALLVRAYRDGVLVGFASLVVHGSTAYVRQAGFDEERTADVPAYMGAIFHAPIRWAYENDVRRLDLSISSDRTKARKGAKPEPRCALVLPLSATANECLVRNLGKGRGIQTGPDVHSSHPGVAQPP